MKQLYDPVKEMFLPDRFIKGECPNCHSKDQYGDSCEVCGKTYNPTDLIEPYSVVSGAKPVEKESTHFFVKLADFEAMLQSWLEERERAGGLQSEVVNKLQEWFADGLRSWDVSRDAPYFGFEIPDQPGKYFYVWVDAPIGYLSSFRDYCDAYNAKHPEKPLRFEDFIDPAAAAKVRHRDGPLHRQGHHLFPHAVLAGDAARRGPAHADRGERARIHDRRRREDVEVARHVHQCAHVSRSSRSGLPALLPRDAARPDAGRYRSRSQGVRGARQFARRRQVGQHREPHGRIRAQVFRRQACRCVAGCGARALRRGGSEAARRARRCTKRATTRR